MAKLVAKHKTRHIGLSNFNILKIKRVIEETGIVPLANQVEMNPYFPQYELLEFCNANGIQVIAHCPLGGGLAPTVSKRIGDGPLEDPNHPVHRRSPREQDTCTNHTGMANGRKICVVPKSANASHIRSNFDMLFPLTEAENTQIAGLMGPRGEHGVRNISNENHIGFDVFDEQMDQPV
ncbi:hypothetical protein DL771_003660 [Monosporascus sp. 5C6A]|nr:hypothetical protein DL771_003660 [Monosporascus sp. 5C6A]